MTNTRKGKAAERNARREWLERRSTDDLLASLKEEPATESMRSPNVSGGGRTLAREILRQRGVEVD